MKITDNYFVFDEKRLEYRCIESDSAIPTSDALVLLHEGLGSIDLWKNFPAGTGDSNRLSRICIF